MAFDITNLDPTGSGSKGAPKIATYTSSDAFTTIEADGYFDSVAGLFTTGDLIYVFSSAAGTANANPKFYDMVVTSGDIALSSGLAVT